MTELEFWKAKLNALRPFLVKNSITEHNAEGVKQLLNETVTFISTPIIPDRFPQVQRVTINRSLPDNKNERIHEIKWLKAPPAEKVVKNSRAGFIGQSVLFATFDYITPLFDLNPKVGISR